MAAATISSKGLPTLEELRAAYAEHPGAVRFLFHGDFREVNEQFRRLVLARHRHRPADVAGYARFRLPYRPRTQLTDDVRARSATASSSSATRPSGDGLVEARAASASPPRAQV